MCDDKAMKYSVMAMGIISWLGGGAVMSIGIVMFLADATFEQTQLIDPEGERDPLWLATFACMMIVGGFTFVTGFLGWIGALKENGSLLLAYLIMSSIALAGLAAGGSLAVAYKFELDSDDTGTQMLEHLTNDYSETGGDVYEVWTEFQTENQCCGVYNYTDWLLNVEFDLATPVPLSCCNLLDGTTSNDTTTELDTCYSEAIDPTLTEFTILYDTGCHDTLQDWMLGYSALAYGLMFGVMALQLVATVLAGCMRDDVGSKNKVNPGY